MKSLYLFLGIALLIIYTGCFDNGVEEQTAECFECKNSIYLAGYTGEGNQTEKGWVRRFDKNGNEDTDWNKELLTGSSTSLTEIEVDSTGNVYVSGTCYLFDQQFTDIWIRKFDKSGNEDLNWYKIININTGNNINGVGYAYHTLEDMKIDSEDNIILTGKKKVYKYNSSVDAGEYLNYFWQMKFDKNGNSFPEPWYNIYSYPAFSFSDDVLVRYIERINTETIVDNYNNIFTMYPVAYGQNGLYYGIHKTGIDGSVYDTDLNKQYEFVSGNSINFIDIEIDDNNYIYIIHQYIGNVIIFNSNLEVNGEISVDNGRFDQIELSKDNMIVGYLTTSDGNYSLRKYTKDGTEYTSTDWSSPIIQHQNSTSDNRKYSMLPTLFKLDSEDNIYFGGWTFNVEVSGYKYCWLKKFDKHGTEIIENWDKVIQFESSGCYPTDIAIIK